MRANHLLLLILLALFTGCPSPPKDLGDEPAKRPAESQDGKKAAAKAPAGSKKKKGKKAKEKTKEELEAEIPPWDREPVKFGKNTYRPSPGYYRIVVLHTNDIHGQVQPVSVSEAGAKKPRLVGGLAVMASAIRQIRAEAEKAGKGFLLLDSGDLFAGTPEGAISRGDVIVDFMNLVGYDALAVGHTDYDEGTSNLRRLAQRAQFPILGANVVETRQGTHPEYIQPYMIKQVGPFRVGVIGLATAETAKLLPRSAWSGHQFTDARLALERVVPQLEKQKVDLVLVLSHLGPTGDAEVASYLRGVAAVIGGHAHVGPSVPRPVLDKVGVITSTPGQGTTIGMLELIVSLRTRELLAAKPRLIELDPKSYPADKQISKLVAKTVKLAEARYGKPVGSLAAPLKRTKGLVGSALGNFLTDAMRIESGAEIAFLSKRGLSRDLPAGKVTGRNIFEVWPSNDRLVLMSLSGRQLTNLLENALKTDLSGLETSGMSIRFDPRRPAGTRLLTMTSQGRSIDPARSYRVVTTERLSQGAEGHAAFRHGTNKKLLDARVHDIFSRYLASNSPYGKPFRQRIASSRAGAAPEKVSIAVLLARGGIEASLFNPALRETLTAASKEGRVDARIEQPEFGGDLVEELRVRTRRGQHKLFCVVGREYGPALKTIAPKHPKLQFVWLTTELDPDVKAPNLVTIKAELTGALSYAGQWAAGKRKGARLGVLAVASEVQAARWFLLFRNGYVKGSRPSAALKPAVIKPAQESAKDDAGALAQARRLLVTEKATVLLCLAGVTAKKIQALAQAQQAYVVGLHHGNLQIRFNGGRILDQLIALGGSSKPQSRSLEASKGNKGIEVVRMGKDN